MQPWVLVPKCLAWQKIKRHGFSPHLRISCFPQGTDVFQTVSVHSLRWGWWFYLSYARQELYQTDLPLLENQGSDKNSQLTRVFSCRLKRPVSSELGKQSGQWHFKHVHYGITMVPYSILAAKNDGHPPVFVSFDTGTFISNPDTSKSVNHQIWFLFQNPRNRQWEIEDD